jgi:hypothetical protein
LLWGVSLVVLRHAGEFEPARPPAS